MVRQMKKILTAIMVAYIPSSLIIVAFIGGDSAFFDTPFVFDVLIILIYTLPILIGMIGVAFCFIRLIESQWHISIPPRESDLSIIKNRHPYWMAIFYMHCSAIRENGIFQNNNIWTMEDVSKMICYCITNEAEFAVLCTE